MTMLSVAALAVSEVVLIVAQVVASAPYMHRVNTVRMLLVILHYVRHSLSEMSPWLSGKLLRIELDHRLTLGRCRNL